MENVPRIRLSNEPLSCGVYNSTRTVFLRGKRIFVSLGTDR